MNPTKLSATGLSAVCLAFFILMVTIAPTWAADDEKIEQQRADIRKMADETLERLYTTQPSAKKAIKNAAGYAVFSNFGMKILFAGGGSGKGLAVNNKTGKDTFMKVIELQAGLGITDQTVLEQVQGVERTRRPN